VNLFSQILERKHKQMCFLEGQKESNKSNNLKMMLHPTKTNKRGFVSMDLTFLLFFSSLFF
jgi:hypothetical protein